MYFIIENSPAGKKILKFEYFSFEKAQQKRNELQYSDENQYCDYYVVKLV